MRRGVWPEEYVPPPPEGRGQRRSRAESKPWAKSKEWVDENEYTEEERLIDARVEGARRWRR
jgi:hypothetical protein